MHYRVASRIKIQFKESKSNMPKASFASADTYSGDFGFKQGWGRITRAFTCVHQFPRNKKTGEQSNPTISAAIAIQALTEDLEPKDGVTETTDYLKIDKGEVTADGVWRASKFRPGKADSRDDDDPEDQGDTPGEGESQTGSEGNCIFVAEEGSKLNSKVKWIVFCKSLEAAGYKPEILHAGYMPDLEGLVAYFEQVKMEKVDEKSEKDPMCLCVRKGSIKVYPYEQSGGKKSKSGAAKGGAAKGEAAKGEAAKGPVAVAKAAAEETSDAADEARIIVMQIAGDQASDSEMPRRKFYTSVLTRCIQSGVGKELDKPKMKALHDAIGALVQDTDWLQEALGDTATVEKDKIGFK